MARKILQTAFFVTIALILQYLYLEGPVMAFSGDYKPFEYTSDGYTLNIEFPGATEVNLTPDKGEEMLLNIYFLNKKLGFRGYIQVWSLKDLEHFLTDSKAKSTYDFVSYALTGIQQNNYPGFKEEWTADFGEDFISAKEYWLELNNSRDVVRISVFTDTAKFPGQLDDTVNHILNSLEVVAKNNDA